MRKQTTRILRIVLIVASIGALAFVPWILVKAWISPLPDTVQAQVTEAVALGLDGVIVYVDAAGAPPAQYAAGWHDRDDKTPASPQALFKIASISKMYVAVAVAKLVSDGRLSLDKTLADYLPELAGSIQHADRITLRTLVQHRSGIPNYTDTPGYWEAPPPTDNRQSLALVLHQVADFAPDEKYGYSNTNYVLIGEILDHTLGYSHHRYIKQEILVPLALHHTYSLLSEVEAEKVMSGYAVGYPGDLKGNDFISPAGSMVATAADVGVFLRALNDGTLLTDREQAIYGSIYEYGHTGLLPGYSSIARYHRDIDAVVIQFVSTSGGYSWNLSEIVYNRTVKIVRES